MNQYSVPKKNKNYILQLALGIKQKFEKKIFGPSKALWM